MITTLCFDVIGTLVDWRGSIKTALGSLPADVSGDRIAHDLIQYYVEGNFKDYRDLVREAAYVYRKYSLDDYMNHDKTIKFINIWGNLKPWLDTPTAMYLLRQKYTTVALTNVTTDTMVRLCKNVGLSFDWIYSAELVGKKKPDPLVYESVCEHLRVEPSEVLMVAAHRFDLRAARDVGMHTCYVERQDDAADSGEDFDYCVDSLDELVGQLGDV